MPRESLPRLHLSALCRGCEEGAFSTPHLTFVSKYTGGLEFWPSERLCQSPLHPAHPCGASGLVQINAPSQERLQRVLRMRGLSQGVGGCVLDGASTGDLWSSHRRAIATVHPILGGCVLERLADLVRDKSETTITPLFTLARNT